MNMKPVIIKNISKKRVDRKCVHIHNLLTSTFLFITALITICGNKSHLTGEPIGASEECSNVTADKCTAKSPKTLPKFEENEAGEEDLGEE